MANKVNGIVPPSGEAGPHSSGQVDRQAKVANQVEELSPLRTIELKIFTLTTIITFLWSGLAINLLQLINYIVFRQLNFSLFTKINYYLMYSAWAQIVTLFDWFFKAEFRVYHAKPEQEEEIFQDHNIFLANHNYELDWVGAWLATDKFGQLASCKAMLKSDLKYVPIVGWSWALSDQLFLDRNWEKDRHKFGSSMDILLKYEPMIATFFCEGTRFTKDRVESCQKFALERGIQAPKYHLIPRTKGFVSVMKHIKQRQQNEPDLKVYIYNAQIAYEEQGAMNIADIIERGLRPKGHLYLEKITLDEIPNDDEACARWLHDLYLRKDTLQEYFNENNSFPGPIDRRFKTYRPRVAAGANWIFWNLYTMLSIFYLVSCLYARYGAFIVSIVMSTFFMLSYVYLNYIMYQADVGNENALTSKKAA